MTAAVLWLLLVGCPDADPCANVDDLALTQGALEVEADHDGWGRTACFQCHTTVRIHAFDCIAEADVDVAALDDAVDIDDTSSCVACHGPNGVLEWIDDDTGDSR